MSVPSCLIKLRGIDGEIPRQVFVLIGPSEKYVTASAPDEAGSSVLGLLACVREEVAKGFLIYLLRNNRKGMYHILLKDFDEVREIAKQKTAKRVDCVIVCTQKSVEGEDDYFIHYVR